MSFDPNHNPPWLCPICNVWMYGRDRQAHMTRHIRPETARRIEEETGVAVDDFVGFCLQQGFELDDLAADDPKVAEALATWKAGDDLPDDEDPRPDPEVWGDLVGELPADPEESPDDEGLFDPFANLPDVDDEEPVDLQVTILWEVAAGTLVRIAGRVTAVEGRRRFRVHDGTGEVAVELAPHVAGGVVVGELVVVGRLVEVVGRKMRDDRGYYIETDPVDWGDLGRGLRV